MASEGAVLAASPAANPGSGVPVTLVTQTRVLPARSEDFAQWQQRVNDVLAGFPGFLDHQVIPPDPPAQVDWVIVQKFASLDAARAWMSSPQRERLLSEVQGWLVGKDDIHIVTAEEAPKTESVSAVISTRIKPGHEEPFREWRTRVQAAESRFPGFEGSKLEPPIPGVQDDWVSIVRFDSNQHLTQWLESPERQRLIAEAAPFTDDVHVRTVRTGFDAWFATKAGTAPPPAWKQNMLVLSALYPVVFLFGLLVQTPILMRQLGMPFWLSLFVSNVASVLILNWLVPWVSRRFGWWLNPKGADPARTNLIGAAVLVAIYAAFLLVFSRIP